LGARRGWCRCRRSPPGVHPYRDRAISPYGHIRVHPIGSLRSFGFAITPPTTALQLSSRLVSTPAPTDIRF
jgi:hypothetical protein